MPQRIARAVLVTLSALAAAVSITACSGSSSEPASDAPLPAYLQGAYTASDDAGAMQWIGFSGKNVYTFLRSGSACTGDVPPPSCFSTGSYTIDAAAKTITLTEIPSGTVTVMPLAVAEAESSSNGSGSSLLSSVHPLDGLTSGSSGGLVNQGSALTTPSSISLTQMGSTQSLVSSPSNSQMCPASGSSSSTSSSSPGSSMSCMASAETDRTRFQDGRTRHAISNCAQWLVAACANVCAVFLPVPAGPGPDIGPEKIEQCEVSLPAKQQTTSGP